MLYVSDSSHVSCQVLLTWLDIHVLPWKARRYSVRNFEFENGRFDNIKKSLFLDTLHAVMSFMYLTHGVCC